MAKTKKLKKLKNPLELFVIYDKFQYDIDAKDFSPDELQFDEFDNFMDEFACFDWLETNSAMDCWFNRYIVDTMEWISRNYPVYLIRKYL